MRTHQNLPPDAPEPARSGTEPNLAHPFKPTPEPWSIERNPPELETGFPFQVIGQQFATVAAVYAGRGRSDAEVESNARLIASAPRMLRVLRSLVEDLEGAQVSDNESGDNRPLSALNEARKILRELEGGAR